MLLITSEAIISSICSSLPLSSTMRSIVLVDKNLMQCHPLTIDGTFRADCLCFDFTGFIELLEGRLENVNWFLVTSFFQILRNIWKYVKHENGDLKSVFLNLAVVFLVKVPWEVFSEIQVSQANTILDYPYKAGLLQRENDLNGTKDVLLGTVLQLLCSLVEQPDLKDEGEDSSGELLMRCNFIDLVPGLQTSYFFKRLERKDKGISLYLRHKMLILMARLTFHDRWHLFHPALWLKLLICNFEDVLFRPISDCDGGYSDLGNCLEGSPFLSSMNDGDTCIHHLQRLVIFLHFKCCFTLIQWKESGQGCLCASESLSFTVDLQLCCETCCNMGLFELSKWLERCDFLQKSTNCKNYSKSCSSFALYFLQLYMEEDDMLFGMLLLLLDAPFFALHEQGIAISKPPMWAEMDVLHHITSTFHPIHLFHWFLTSLHYDHSVLIDYLISKHAGVQCVQYILRCLRITCKFWSVFIEYSTCGSEINTRYFKRQKISEEVKGQTSSTITSSRTNRNIRLPNFESAKECLLSLKKSVEDLHQKSLFPYNPKPLLRSLTRFEELCTQ